MLVWCSWNPGNEEAGGLVMGGVMKTFGYTAKEFVLFSGESLKTWIQEKKWSCSCSRKISPAAVCSTDFRSRESGSRGLWGKRWWQFGPEMMVWIVFPVGMERKGHIWKISVKYLTACSWLWELTGEESEKVSRILKTLWFCSLRY